MVNLLVADLESDLAACSNGNGLSRRRGVDITAKVGAVDVGDRTVLGWLAYCLGGCCRTSDEGVKDV